MPGESKLLEEIHKTVNPELLQIVREQYPFINLERIHKMLCYLKISCEFSRFDFGSFHEYIFDKNALIFLSGNIPDKDILNKIDWNKRSNLIYAFLSGKTEILEWLQNNKKINFQSATAAQHFLLYALLSGSPQQADWINKKMRFWQYVHRYHTAFYAALSGVPEQLEWVAKHIPEDLTIVNRGVFERMPLNGHWYGKWEDVIHYAIASGNPKQVTKAIYYFFGGMPKQALNAIKLPKWDDKKHIRSEIECEEKGPYDYLVHVAEISADPEKMLPYVSSLISESKPACPINCLSLHGCPILN